MRVSLTGRKVSFRLAGAAVFVVAACLLTSAQSSPPVHLDAEAVAPRPIDDLTRTTVARHYALAWRELASALQSGQPGVLGDEFVGFAKNRLVQRIAEQNKAGLHVRIVDHGHQLKAVFYSTDGTAIQLFDRAQLETQTFDGNNLLDAEKTTHEYVVLMTPGADRWYVRDLEEVSATPF